MLKNKVKYRCYFCRDKRHGGYENLEVGKRWVCHFCFIEQNLGGN